MVQKAWPVRKNLCTLHRTLVNIWEAITKVVEYSHYKIIIQKDYTVDNGSKLLTVLADYKRKILWYFYQI